MDKPLSECQQGATQHKAPGGLIVRWPCWLQAGMCQNATHALHRPGITQNCTLALKSCHGIPPSGSSAEKSLEP